MPECPIASLSNWRFGSRRDETRRDDARHGATRGREFDEELAEEQARRQNEVYVALIRELERGPDDARGAVAAFLQDLRRDGVDWYRVGDGGEFDVDDKESFFRTVHAGACMRAARIMGSGCLKFAREHVAPWDEWTCAFAAMNGNLDCLKYAHEHGCPWNENTCIAAASNGHLDCLKYAHENGCPWDKRTCDNAARYGHLECLEYAHENGCPWDKDECIDAALAYGNTACLTYMRTLKDAVESKLDDAMSALDEIARDIPEGAYVTICAALKLSHDEHKKRKR